MDVLTLMSVAVLAFGGKSSMPLNGSFPVILAAEQTRFRDPHPLFPLLETHSENTGFAQETMPNLEPGIGTSELGFGGPNVPLFVPLGTPNLPQKDSLQDSLFVPLSPNPTED